MNTCSAEDQLKSDEALALEIEAQCSVDIEIPAMLQIQDEPLKSIEEMYLTIRSKVDDSQQLLLVVRRGVPFTRLLQLWQRESNTTSPTHSLSTIPW